MKKTIGASFLILALLSCQNLASTAKVSQSKINNIDTAIDLKQDKSYVSQNNPLLSNNVNSSVKLIDSGRNPKRELFFTPTVNSTETLIMTMDMGIKISMNNQTLPSVENPKIKMEIEFKVTEIDRNGYIHGDFEYKKVEVLANANTPPEMVTAMNTEMSKIEGLKGSLIMDRYGNTKDVKYILPDTINPNMKQRMEQMLDSIQQLSSPFPSEALGVGAKWQTNQSLNMNGMILNQVINYEILKINGKNITLSFTLNQSADSQIMKSPQLPPNISMELMSLSSTGGGEILINLDRLMPINSTLTSSSNTEIKMTEKGNPQVNVLRTENNLNLILKSK